MQFYKRYQKTYIKNIKENMEELGLSPAYNISSILKLIL